MATVRLAEDATTRLRMIRGAAPPPAAWEVLPAGFEGKDFEFDRDPARNFVEQSKGSTADPPEKKVVNISDTSLWTGDQLVAFSVSRTSRGLAIHVASPLAPGFLAKEGVANAILEMALEMNAGNNNKDAYRSEQFVEEGGYEPGLQAFEEAGRAMGVEVKMGNERLPCPRVGYAKTTQKGKAGAKLREKIEPLCVIIDSGVESAGPIRKRQKARQTAGSGKRRSAGKRAPTTPTPRGVVVEEEEELSGNVAEPMFAPLPYVPDTNINDLHQNSLEASYEQLSREFNILQLELSNHGPIIPLASRLDCWRLAPLASPIIPTVIPSLSIKNVIAGYIEL